MSDAHPGPNVIHDPAVSAVSANAAHAGAAAAPGHGSARDHDAHGGHDDMALGPIDWTAWATGVVAVVAGAIVAVCAAISTGAIGT